MRGVLITPLDRRPARLLALLLFVALLPALLFVGHPFTSAGAAAPDGRAEQHDPHADQEHARHCHSNLGACSDAPLAAGPGQLLLSEDLQPAPPLQTRMLVVDDARPLPPAAAWLTDPPPRYAA